MISPGKISLLFSLLLLLLACSSQAVKSVKFTPAAIQELLPGDYIGKSSRGEVYHSIAQLHLPAFGGDIFYHHISSESLRGPAMQRKIYVFDESGEKMQSTVLLGSGDVFADDQDMIHILNEMTEEQLLRFPESCQFQWQNNADGYVAQVSRERCSYESPAFGGLVSPEMEYHLSRCGLTISEGIYREDGSAVFPAATTDNLRLNSAVEDCQ